MARSLLLGRRSSKDKFDEEGQRAKLSKLNPDPLISSNNPSLLSPTHSLPAHTPLPHRPMTPTLLSFRFGGRSLVNDDKKHRRASVNSMPDRKGKEPMRGGGEEMNLNEDLGQPVWSSRGYGVTDPDPFASRRPSHDPPPPPSSSRPSTSSGIPSSLSRKPQRGSIFNAASDVLGIKLGFARRRGPPVKLVPEPVVLPDVIEITARKRDEEEEERSRLRAEAAQAIGLVDTEVQSHHIDTDEEVDDGMEERSMGTRHGGVHNLTESVHSAHYSNGPRNSMYTPHTSTQVHGSSTSVAATSPPPPMPVGRYRSGSFIGSGGHSRSNSANLTPVPTYPATVSSLTQWQQHVGTVPKYYPPSSLRIFALSNSKNWKSRYMMLTSPTAIITRTRTPAVSYLHLFKGSGADEKELERLVINEDSVAFVSDDEVGGRRHVIKVGGIEGGAFKKELNVEESGRTMWFLHIEDQQESKQWITCIKTSILNQRALRAGLLPSAGTNIGVNEPRGDIDVILSMRAQGLASSHSNARQHHSTPPSTVAAATTYAEQHLTYASSISEHSLHSQASSPSKNPSLAVSTLRSLFSVSRPRSGSRATSDTAKLSSQQQQHPQAAQHEGPSSDSGGGMGNNLISMIRPGTPDLQSQSSGATATFIVPASPSPAGRPSSPPFVPSVAPEIGLDRYIIAPDGEEQREQRSSNDFDSANSPPTTPMSPGGTRAAKALSVGSISLQPPPRGKRWTSTAVMTPPSSQGVSLTVSVSPAKESTPAEVYKNAQFNSTTGSLGALTYTHYNKDANLASEPGSPTAASMVTGTTDRHSNHLHPSVGSHRHSYQGNRRPSSAHSISTFSATTSNGGDSMLGIDRTSSSASTKRTNSSQGVRRWSRQGQGSLPARTSPPAGPPPNPPSSATSTPLPSSHPGTAFAIVESANRPNSRASSAISANSQQSIVSSLPSFSKRTSVSSVGTTSSNSHSANGNAHGHGVGLVVRGPGVHRYSMPPPARPAPTSALPPAPGEQQHTSSSPPQNQSLNSRGGRSRPRSVDSSVPNSVTGKSKRSSITGRGFRLSMIAPSKPPPSSNLPPRPDELGGYDNSGKAKPPPSTSFRPRLSGGNSRLSRLNPIPASPDPSNVSTGDGDGSNSAPFPPPRGPLPPTPPHPDHNTNNSNTRHSGGISRHISFKERLRIRSAPSSSSSTTAPAVASSVSQDAGANVSSANANANNASSTSAQALSNTSPHATTLNTITNDSMTTSSPRQSFTQFNFQDNHTHTRSLASRFHHARHSSLTNNNNFSTQSPPTPISPTSSSYHDMPNGEFSSPFSLPPDTPIGEKIINFKDEASFLNLVADTPISPTFPLPPRPPPTPPILNGGPLSSMGLTGMGMGMGPNGMPIRPLPAIPVSSEVTPLSPPPRRNSRQLSVVEHNPAPAPVPPALKMSPPRTPSTPSIFEDTFGTEKAKESDEAASTDERQLPSLAPPPPHIRTHTSHTFGPSDPPSPTIEKDATGLAASKEPLKRFPLLSLPPSPLLDPTTAVTIDEMSATPPDTPSYETSGMSPSSPASVYSLGMKTL
ncbi:hypothetical protein D9756_004781 [Leucocoprinus leucothites]|uniref:PH domain-containing protein n=1 Tax=Leucocoprinus leucothites TaxID=201217 RepID=A0A8H5LKJ8_9AGAR|nr:hypothetical protein D9756_004781 [Leucoagaricus leucothites]